MTKCIIIADDLTGASATCSLFKKVGLKSATITNLEGYDDFNMDVVAYSTNSRDFTKEDSYNTVRDATLRLKNSSVQLYSKRIDFSMRGNIGSEIDGILDALEDRIAIVVPSYPDSGSIVVNGLQLINGELCERQLPQIMDIITSQSKNRCKYIHLEDISKGVKHISNLLKEYSKDSKIIIFDAVLNKDILNIAKGVILSKLKIVSVDPGPFTVSYVMESLNIKNKLKNVLMVVGSVDPVTVKQVDFLLEKDDIFLVRVNSNLLIDDKSRKEEIRIAIDKINHGIKCYEHILLTTISTDERKRASEKKLNKEISIALGEITKSVLNKNKFCGIFSCGGEVTVEILKGLEAKGVEILEEIAPLVSYGKILGGLNSKLNFISKGGGVGEDNIIRICVEKLKA